MSARRSLPPHGTTARYLRDCRCPPCVRRMSRYNKFTRIRRERGFHGVVDAGPAARHVAVLRAAGASLQAIADAAGCSEGTVLRLERGVDAVFASTAARILAVAVPPPSFTVSPVGAMRRVQALFAIGYPLAVIAQQTGLARTYVSQIANGHPAVIKRATHEAVCAAYEALSGRPGPSAYSRAWALRRGWVPPLAWDDWALDDPGAVPVKGALVGAGGGREQEAA